MENLADATGVLGLIRDDLGAYFGLMEERYKRLGKRLLRMGALVTVGFVVALLLLAVGQRQTTTATKAATTAIEANRLGIRVSCVLLARTIKDATATGGSPTPASAASRERGAIAFTIIARNATAAERDRLRVLTKRITDAGGAIAAPPCEDAAAHPERYRNVEP